MKCIYIAPAYNRRPAFEHCDDNLEHSQWLAMIWPRLVLLRELLAEDGSIWVSIDDNEGHYLKDAAGRDASDQLREALSRAGLMSFFVEAMAETRPGFLWPT